MRKALNTVDGQCILLIGDEVSHISKKKQVFYCIIRLGQERKRMVVSD